MPYNLNDPNLDFSLEEQLMKAEFLRNKAQQAPQETIRQIGGNVAPWSAGRSIANAMNKTSGSIDQRRTEDAMRGLSAEQLSRLGALRGQLTPTTPVNMQDPNAMMAENARQAAIYGQMSNLPMGAEQAKQGLGQTSKLPQSMMGKAQANNYATQTATTADDRNVLSATTANNRLAERERIKAAALLEQQRLDRLSTMDVAKQRGLNAGKGTTSKNAAKKANADSVLYEMGDIYETILDFQEGEFFDASTGPVAGKLTNTIGGAAAGLTKQGTGADQFEGITNKVKTFGKRVATMGDKGKLGNMAVQEWTFVEKAAANLNPSSPEFDEQLARFKVQLQRFMDLASKDLEQDGDYNLEQYARGQQEMIKEMMGKETPDDAKTQMIDGILYKEENGMIVPVEGGE
jgi:hypothetical protein